MGSGKDSAKKKGTAVNVSNELAMMAVRGGKVADALHRMMTHKDRSRRETAMKVAELRTRFHDLYALNDNAFDRVLRMAIFEEEHGIRMRNTDEVNSNNDE